MVILSLKDGQSRGFGNDDYLPLIESSNSITLMSVSGNDLNLVRKLFPAITPNMDGPAIFPGDFAKLIYFNLRAYKNLYKNLRNQMDKNPSTKEIQKIIQQETVEPDYTLSKDNLRYKKLIPIICGGKINKKNEEKEV